MDDNFLSRFNAKVDTERAKTMYNGTRCHEWTGYLMKSGYGQLRRDGKTCYAHRTSWEIANGGPVPNGLQVLHHCDNRKCVNPAHLFLGTLDDNMADMFAKRRQAHGPRCFHAKLTVKDVHAIRSAPDLQATLASKFGVTQSVISMIRSGKIWRFV